MKDSPSYFGIDVYRRSPCCEREVMATVRVGSYDGLTAGVEDVLIELRATAEAVEHLKATARYSGGPCVSCLNRGNIDPVWLAEYPMECAGCGVEVSVPVDPSRADLPAGSFPFAVFLCDPCFVNPALLAHHMAEAE